MTQAGHETFEHVADVGIRGFGSTLEEAFVQAAKAMFELMAGDLQAVALEQEVQVSAEGYDLESLFVAWLNALLTQADLQGAALAAFEAHIHGLSLLGKAWGAPRSRDPESLGVEVKGATYAQLAVWEVDGLWTAQCVVDV